MHGIVVRRLALLALAAASCGCNEKGSSGSSGAGSTSLSIPAGTSIDALSPRAAWSGSGETGLGGVSAAPSAPEKPVSAPDNAEGVAQNSRVTFDGDTRSLVALNEPTPVVAVSGQGGGKPKVQYTAQPKKDTLKIKEPPPPGQGLTGDASKAKGSGREKIHYPPNTDHVNDFPLDDSDEEIILASAKPSGKSPSLKSKDWIVPVPRHDDGRKAKISSGFHKHSEQETEDERKTHRTHRGHDIMYRKPKCTKQILPWEAKCYDMAAETPALAAQDGVVVMSDDVETGGAVLIDHGGGVKTGYAHLSKRLVKLGERVTAGQSIGIIGGNPQPRSYNLAHLHFDLLVNGQYVDALPYFVKWTHVQKPSSSPVVAMAGK